MVVDALDALPDHLDPELVAKAEAQMVAYCEEFRPSELRRLGRHLLEVVAPEIAEAEEAKRLENEEQQAREKTSLRSQDSSATAWPAPRSCTPSSTATGS